MWLEDRVELVVVAGILLVLTVQLLPHHPQLEPLVPMA
jgi:hypothetical protein